jgi:hypothetical protein
MVNLELTVNSIVINIPGKRQITTFIGIDKGLVNGDGTD